eukprot:284819439_1
MFVRGMHVRTGIEVDKLNDTARYAKTLSSRLGKKENYLQQKHRMPKTSMNRNVATNSSSQWSCQSQYSAIHHNLAIPDTAILRESTRAGVCTAGAILSRPLRENFQGFGYLRGKVQEPPPDHGQLVQSGAKPPWKDSRNAPRHFQKNCTSCDPRKAQALLLSWNQRRASFEKVFVWISPQDQKESHNQLTQHLPWVGGAPRKVQLTRQLQWTPEEVFLLPRKQELGGLLWRSVMVIPSCLSCGYQRLLRSMSSSA